MANVCSNCKPSFGCADASKYGIIMKTLLSCSTTNRRNLNVLPLFRSLGLAFVISRCLAKCSIIIKASNEQK